MSKNQQIRKFEYSNFIKDHLNIPHNLPYYIASEQSFQHLDEVYFPYRNFFYGLGVIKEGEAEITISSTTYELKPQTLITIGPGILRHWKSGYDTLKQEVLFFTAEIFLEDFKGQFLSQFQYFRPEALHCHELSTENYQKVRLLLGLIREEKLERTVPGLIYSLLKFLVEICPNRLDYINLQKDSAVRIADTFKLLLDQYYLEHRDVEFYAKQINISSKYLGETVKKITGKSPKSWINEMLMNEAKSLLKQTQLSIKEISFQLGFEHASYFVKKFKKHENITPGDYRLYSP